MNLIETLEAENGKDSVPTVHVGDTVIVHYLIREGDKERIQLFNGTVIAMGGRGINVTITVRRIVQGEGVERIFPLHSPRVKEVEIQRRGDVRRSKLFYLRDRVGKKTRVKELLGEKARRLRAYDEEVKATQLAAAAERAAAKQAGQTTASEE
ncbi:MAG: large subunit ribosomal protein L19 [Candidatus Paceibacteria bacterium]|jgi:large subunit ribosomal protein L19